MSLETRVNALATQLGVDYKALLSLIGVVADLDTVAGDLVGAINEVVSAVNAASGIDDSVTSAGSTWSSSKIDSELSLAVSGLVDSSPDVLNTLNELASALENNPDVIVQIRSLVNDNATAIQVLAANVGDTDADFLETYTSAKTA